MDRGDITVQTSTIVFLTIGMVLLLLVVGLVVVFFAKTAEEVHDQASKVPDPPLPTRTQPITISAPALQAGKPFTLKLRALPPPGVYNPTVFLYCNKILSDDSTSYITDAVASFRPAKDGTSVIFSYVGVLAADTPNGNLLCRADVAGYDTNGNPALQEADVVLMVG